jgi:hypothetical protein
MNGGHLAAISRCEKDGKTVGGHDSTDDTRLIGKTGISLREKAVTGFNHIVTVNL